MDAARRVVHRAGGLEDGARRRDRIRQDDPRLSRGAALRRRPGQHLDRRRRPARPHVRVTRIARRRRLSGDVPLSRLGTRQPALREARRDGRGARRRGRRGADPRADRVAAGRLRHRRRRARLPLLRRREAAHRDRPDDPPQPADPRPRRGDERARHGDRAPGAGGARPARGRAHDDRDRSPHLDDRGRRPDPRARPGARSSSAAATTSCSRSAAATRSSSAAAARPTENRPSVSRLQAMETSLPVGDDVRAAPSG